MVAPCFIFQPNGKFVWSRRRENFLCNHDVSFEISIIKGLKYLLALARPSSSSKVMCGRNIWSRPVNDLTKFINSLLYNRKSRRMCRIRVCVCSARQFRLSSGSLMCLNITYEWLFHVICFTSDLFCQFSKWQSANQINRHRIRLE